MNEKQQIMSFNLLDIFKSDVFLMKVDEPSEISWIGSYNVMLSFFCFCGDVTSVWIILYS